MHLTNLKDIHTKLKKALGNNESDQQSGPKSEET